MAEEYVKQTLVFSPGTTEYGFSRETSVNMKSQ